MTLASETNHLLSILQQRYGIVCEQTSERNPLRSKFWDRFQELGLPSKKDEVFRRIPLRQLYEQSFQPAENVTLTAQGIENFILPECQKSVIVFVNGSFSATLSRLDAIPSKVSIVSMTEALKTFSSFLTNHWTITSREEIDPFAAMNGALHGEGCFVYVPPKTIIETPIQVLHLVAADTSTLCQPRLQVFAGAQSDLKFVATHGALTTQPFFYNSVADLHLEDDASLKFYQWVSPENDDSWFFHAYRPRLKRNSLFQAVDLTEGSRTVRTDYHCVLNGENGEALLNHLWMLSKKREAHSHVLMDHRAPHCHSMQLFKGALGGYSRSSFEGKILVRQAAQKTDAFQLNNNLLLSERAHAYSKPNLEIFADDVKASHGATFGQLDEEHLFYLKSRGFSSDDAKNLLVFGYCEELVKMIPVPSLFEKILERARCFLLEK